MNGLVRIWKKAIHCSHGDHTALLRKDELQVLQYMDIHTSCTVCGQPLILQNNDADTYWEIED